MRLIMAKITNYIPEPKPEYKIEDKDRIKLEDEIYKARAFFPQGKDYSL